jgi:hypothetical protein
MVGADFFTSKFITVILPVSHLPVVALVPKKYYSNLPSANHVDNYAEKTFLGRRPPSAPPIVNVYSMALWRTLLTSWLVLAHKLEMSWPTYVRAAEQTYDQNRQTA